MKPPTVDQIMNKPVYTVDATETVGEAQKRMQEKGTKKILVKDDNRPIGILEEWMITDSDNERPVNKMDLRPFGTAPKGALLFDIKREIMDFSAVYIYDPEAPDEFVGVVTTFDFVKAV